MINKLRLFGLEIRQSIGFLILITAEITICLFLFNYALTKLDSESIFNEYYGPDVANYSWVSTDNAELWRNNAVSDLKDKVNLNELATCVEFGRIKKRLSVDGSTELKYVFNQSIEIFTPQLWDNFNHLQFDIMPKKVNDYYEAYISQYSDYTLNKINEVEYKNSIGEINIIKIKPIRRLTSDAHFYKFIDQNIISKPYSSDIFICGDISEFDLVEITGGIFINDKTPDYYRSLGFTSMTVEEVFQSNKSKRDLGYGFTLYSTIIAIIFAVGTLLCFYVIHINKMTRKRTIAYVCGLSASKQFIIEILKLLTAFGIAVIINYVATALTFISNALGDYSISIQFLISLGIIFGTYILALIVGIIKYARTDIVKTINNEH